MKNTLIILILLMLAGLVFASNVDNLLFKLSNDFCNQIYADISSSSSPNSLNSLAILKEYYSINNRYAKIFSDQLIIDLSKKIQIVDREHLKAILAEKKLDLAGLLQSSNAYLIGNLVNVKGFLNVSVYNFSYKPVVENNFFVESKGYKGSLNGSYKIIGLDSAYKLGGNIEVKDKYLVITKHFAQPISYVLASLAGSLACDYYYFSDVQSDLQCRLIVDSAVGIFTGLVLGNILYKILP